MVNTLILCLEIFFARIVDVSIGVIRTVELVKDNTKKAAVLAFFEVLIWFIVAREALRGEANILIAIFYSLGYATGTLIGSYLSNKLISGSVTIQVISYNIMVKDIKKIQSGGYGVSYLKMNERNKKLILIEVDKKRIKEIITLIKSIDSKAFITVSDTKEVCNGYVSKGA